MVLICIVTYNAEHLVYVFGQTDLSSSEKYLFRFLVHFPPIVCDLLVKGVLTIFSTLILCYPL